MLIGRVLIVAKSAYYFRHVRPFHCLSVCSQISARFPLDSCRDIWYWELLWKSDTKAQTWLKSVKNIVHFSWRPELVWLLSTTLNRHKSALFDRNCNRMFVRPSVPPYVRLSARVNTDATWHIYAKFYLEDFYENLLRISSTFTWKRTKLSGTLLYMMTQVDLLLPATLNRHKSPLLVPKGLRLLGQPRRYKHYGKALHRYLYTYIAYLL